MAKKPLGKKTSFAILLWGGLILLTPFIILYRIFFGENPKPVGSCESNVKIANVNYDELPIEAQKYSALIDELKEVFLDCRIVRLGEGRSRNNINIMRGALTLVTVRAAGEEYPFNSDAYGLAVGFRDDAEINARVNTKSLDFIEALTDKGVTWNYYRIKASSDVRNLYLK